MNKQEAAIKQIREAYSMQPGYWDVVSPEMLGNYYDKPNACKEINLELVTVGDPQTGDASWFYVGYNYEGKKLFQFRQDSVNVIFE